MFCVFNRFNLIAADLPVDKIKKCMGNPEDDVENAVLKAEQEIQVILASFSPFPYVLDLFLLRPTTVLGSMYL